MLSRISIRTQSGTLAIQTQNAALETKPDSTRLQLKDNAKPSLEIHRTYPRLQIDQSASFEGIGMGFGDHIRSMDRYYDKMLQEGIQTISRIVSDGVHYLQIEKKGNPTVELAKQKMDKLNQHQLTIAAIKPPKVSVQTGTLEVSAPDKVMTANWSHTEGTANYRRGQVDVSWRTRPSIDISVVPGTELHFPGNTGRRMDDYQ